MKKTAYIILALLALVIGLWACNSKQEPVNPEAAAEAGVDLRYRVNDIYNLTAFNPETITIVVKSTKPWTVRSYHPDWCMISQESGEAVPDSLVHVGKGENTTIKVQYYDNIMLDDRTDYIEIASDGYVGKKVTVNQKGSAYISVPEDEQEILLPKDASEAFFHVLSNQSWSTAITEIDGDWLTIKEGATGEKDGVVTVSAQQNTKEMRYATVTLYDRHSKKVVDIKYTQDGVQLEPADDKMSAEWTACEIALDVAANTKWTVTKKDESDDWFTISTPSFTGNGTIKLQVQQNDAKTVRNSVIVIKTEADENGFFVSHEILVRQAYKVEPVRIFFNEAEIGEWSVTSNSTWTAKPSFNGVGALIPSPTQIYRTDAAAGMHIFHWTNIDPAARVRFWNEITTKAADGTSQYNEIKYNIEAGSTDISISSVLGSLPNKKNATYDASVTTHDVGVGYTQNGDYCHVSFYLDGNEFYSFDTSETFCSMYTWQASLLLYIGLDHGGSAVCEYYDYTPPFSWD